MSVTDPRSVLRSYFDPGADCKVVDANLLLEDGVTEAKYEANYQLSERTLTNLFHTHNLDIVFIVGRPHVRPIITASGAVGYTHELYVQPTIIDKWSGSGAVSVIATKLLDSAVQEIRRVINENMAGSGRFRLEERETFTPERVDSTLIWGTPITVLHYQFVSEYGTYTVALRRFTNYVAEWRVGTTGAVYASVGPSSGIGFRFVEDDPWVKLPIPGAANAVYQLMGNPDVTGSIAINDFEAVTTLLYETAVSGTDYAVTATSRFVIGYMALVIYHTKIVNATDVRSSPTSTFVFTNARIGQLQKPFEQPADPWIIDFYADSVTLTDSA